MSVKDGLNWFNNMFYEIEFVNTMGKKTHQLTY